MKHLETKTLQEIDPQRSAEAQQNAVFSLSDGLILAAIPLFITFCIFAEDILNLSI
jgi:hypothetical protein